MSFAFNGMVILKKVGGQSSIPAPIAPIFTYPDNEASTDFETGWDDVPPNPQFDPPDNEVSAVFEPLIPTVSQTTGLTQHYAAEGDALDSAGTDDGTLINIGVTYTAGYGGGLAFNTDGGVQGRVSIPASANNLLIGFDYSWDAWVFPRSFPFDPIGQIWLKLGNEAQVAQPGAGGDFRFVFAKFFGAGYISVTSPDYSFNQWYHVGATVDESAALLRLYVNGIEVAVNSSSGASFNDAGQPMSIGDAENNPGSRQLDAKVDDLRLYRGTIKPASHFLDAAAAGWRT